jgi:hypothetical protein
MRRLGAHLVHLAQSSKEADTPEEIAVMSQFMTPVSLTMQPLPQCALARSCGTPVIEQERQLLFARVVSEQTAHQGGFIDCPSVRWIVA